MVPVGVVSVDWRAMDRQSAMPRTRSALPIRPSGPSPMDTGWVSETYGVCQICTGCAPAGSLASARRTTRVPSSKSAWPWQEIGVATSLRIRL